MTTLVCWGIIGLGAICAGVGMYGVLSLNRSMNAGVIYAVSGTVGLFMMLRGALALMLAATTT